MMREASDTRKEQIIQAAMEIIVTDGLEKLTMQRLGGAVGITDAAIYKHFAGKQEVLLAMISTIRQQLLRHVRQHMEASESPLEKLQLLLQGHLQFIEEQDGTPHLLFSEALYTSDPELRNTIRQIIAEYTGLVRNIAVKGRSTGELREDLDPGAVPVALLGLIQSSVMQWVLSDRAYSLAAQTGHLWNIFEHGIRSQE